MVAPGAAILHIVLNCIWTIFTRLYKRKSHLCSSGSSSSRVQLPRSSKYGIVPMCRRSRLSKQHQVQEGKLPYARRPVWAYTCSRGLQSRSEKLPTVRFDLIELDTTSRAEVQDLCALLTEASKTNKSLKLYLYEHGKLAFSHHPMDPQMQHSTSSLPVGTITLEAIIQKTHNSKMRRNLKQRLLLAYRLASSLLQFHSTPWLGGSWKKQSICFPHNSVAVIPGKNGSQFDADSPYIIHDFESSPVALPESHPKTKTSLLDLGILLLEIWHLTPCEVYAAREGLHLGSTYGARNDVASRWLNDTADNMVPSYADCVCRCIEGTFASRTSTLQWTDRELQASICENLIMLLWDICSSKTR